MSGSSYSRSSYTGGVLGVDSISDCSKLHITTRVVSPTMSFFATVAVGNVLGVELDNSIITLLDQANNAVGSVHPRQVEMLIKCLEDGNMYEATIDVIHGASINVTIKPK